MHMWFSSLCEEIRKILSLLAWELVLCFDLLFSFYMLYVLCSAGSYNQTNNVSLDYLVGAFSQGIILWY